MGCLLLYCKHCIFHIFDISEKTFTSLRRIRVTSWPESDEDKFKVITLLEPLWIFS